MNVEELQSDIVEMAAWLKNNQPLGPIEEIHTVVEQVPKLIMELEQSNRELQSFADQFGGGNVVLAMTNCQQAKKDLDESQSLVATLRAQLADPPPDVQEAVIKKLGLISKDAFDTLVKDRATQFEHLRLAYHAQTAELEKAQAACASKDDVLRMCREFEGTQSRS